MNNIEKLFNSSKKGERTIIGLMSGTSLDGLDVALCLFKGSGRDTQVKLLYFETVAYSDVFREDIKKIFSKQQADLELICLLNEKIALTHASIINELLQKWNINANKVDAIASHGQTIYHAPKIKHQLQNYPNGTLQIGDGDHIAVNTQIITISDFRQKNIAGGGEGAPLAVYGDYLLFSNAAKSTVLLNIGGISNISFIPSENSKRALFSTDLGPGNTLCDQFMQKHYQLNYDKNAFYAKQGSVNQDLLNALFDNTFFGISVPKSTGPELFNLEYLKLAQEKSKTQNIHNTAILATLCEFTALAIAKEINNIGEETEIIISGGGIHNPLIVERLKYHLPHHDFVNIEKYGITADAKEAVLFALLANETLSGRPTFIADGVPNICMGKISFPF